MTTLSDLARMAVNELEAAESSMDAHDFDGAIAHALVSIAATLVRTSAPSSIEHRRASTFGEYDHDAMVQDREELWADDPDEKSARRLRDSRG